ncbi:dirigent 22-like [Olea europaea subsp. europaea]|uniref:Dirigent protein n=1 Tax=Olea europaea subsp. europaea TaxID=158383 RepID=A0A8S0RSN5_OLEEU|nr:dirigent 22-like [Olea europaea subsp. europaea]
MASFLTSTYHFTMFFILLSTFLAFTDGKFSEQYPNTKATIHDKISHLHFYFHDIVSGKNPTAILIAGQRNSFGSTAMIDDPLTEGPEPSSKLVGRAQGMYAMTSQQDGSLLMVVNFAFNEGKFNGSSVSVIGRNPVLDAVREMPVVGGSGIFRLARGYALAKTYQYNITSGDAVVEYNVFITHD